MATTMKLIAKNVLGSDTASVTFSDIPATYTDLMLLCSLRTAQTDTVGYAGIRFNSDAGSNYTVRLLTGNGSSAGSSSFASQSSIFGQGTSGASTTANTFGSLEFYIPNYTASVNKSVSATTMNENNASAAYMSAVAGLWSSTAAITSITIGYFSGYNLLADSSMYLYGIKKA